MGLKKKPALMTQHRPISEPNVGPHGQKWHLCPTPSSAPLRSCLHVPVSDRVGVWVCRACQTQSDMAAPPGRSTAGGRGTPPPRSTQRRFFWEEHRDAGPLSFFHAPFFLHVVDAPFFRFTNGRTPRWTRRWGGTPRRQGRRANSEIWLAEASGRLPRCRQAAEGPLLHNTCLPNICNHLCAIL